MHILRTWAQVAAMPADSDLRQLLDRRRQQLEEYGELSDLGCIAIVQPGDTLADIEEALSFAIGPHPTWEWIARHGDYWELPFVISDDGSGFVLIVPDRPDIDAKLLTLIHAYAS